MFAVHSRSTDYTHIEMLLERVARYGQGIY
jgi:hypothetical protein